MPRRLRRRKGSAFGPLRALAPPSPPRPPEGVFDEKTPSGKVIKMRMKQCVKVIGGSILLAAMTYAMLAAPGLLTDTASTIPLAAVRP